MPSFLAQPSAGAEAASWIDIVRHDVSPVLAAYLVFLAFVVAFARTRRRGGSQGARVWPLHPEKVIFGDPTHGHLFRYLLGTAMGGYLFFLLIVGVFYLVLGNEPASFLREALIGGAALGFGIGIPALMLLGWAEQRRSGRRSGSIAPRREP